MGASFDSTKIKAKSISELKSAYVQVKQSRAWESGHGGYTGTFAETDSGLKIVGGLWEEKKAREHCIENHPKWEQAWAYQIGQDEWFVGAWCSS